MKNDSKLSHEELVSTPEGRRLLEQEVLLVSASNFIAELLEEKGMTRAELARRIGKSKAFVTQILGGRNITLRTLADLAWALDTRIRIETSQEKRTQHRADQGKSRSLAGTGRRPIKPQPGTGSKRSILELRGLGKETWRGVDPQNCVDAERASWKRGH